jgi:resuscitation-promoting factor RpfA
MRVGEGALVRIDRETMATAVSAALGFVAALTLGAPMALADPLQSEPVVPVASPATPVEPAPAGPAPAPAPALAVAPTPAEASAATPAVAVAPTPAVAPAPAPTVAVAATPAVASAPDPPIDTPAPTPAPDGTVQPVAVDPVTPPNGVPHLSSPENLPPGTTDTRPDNSGRGMSYLRDIWHAYQTQEVDGKGALLLLTQRPMDANAAPPPGMPANPTPPMAPLPPVAAPPDAPPVS